MSKWVLADAEKIRENLTKEQEDEISLLYRKVYLSVRQQMLAIPKDGTVSEQIQKQYLDKLHKQLDEAYKSLGVGLEKQIAKNVKKAAEGVVNDAVKQIKSYGFSITGAFSFVPKDIVNSLVTGQVYGGNWSLSKAIWNSVEKNQSDINKIIASGVAANKNAYDIAKDLETYVNPKSKKSWDWNKVYPGTSKKIDYNAQRLARTMVSHAYQQSLERVCKNNPFVDGYIWQAAHSARVCPICNARDGQFFAKGELPLDHPNGMCTFLANIPYSMEGVADRLAAWAHGGDDPEIDAWAQSITGAKLEPMFNAEQKKFLEPHGYSPTNMPQSTSEFLHSLTSEEMADLFTLAGVDWSHPHPYQVAGAYYEKNLAVVRQGFKPIANTGTKAPVFDPKTWISGVKKNTLGNMLDTEEAAFRKITSAEEEALRLYTGNSYRQMNGYLRDRAYGYSKEEAIQNTNITQQRLNAITTASKGLQTMAFAEDIYVRRGSSIGDLAGLISSNSTEYRQNKTLLNSLDISELQDKMVNTVGSFAGFTSTSSLWDRGFSGDVEYIFKVPKGASAASIMSISNFGTSEGETLLDAGTKVRVVGIEESDGHMGSSIQVFLEVLK